MLLQAHQFCPRCGSPTEPASFGTKRRCVADSQHRLYPRTDSVVIMLVESPDGQKALLGRSKGLRASMQTCLSGFVDQAESIEEVSRCVITRLPLYACTPMSSYQAMNTKKQQHACPLKRSVSQRHCFHATPWLGLAFCLCIDRCGAHLVKYTK